MGGFLRCKGMIQIVNLQRALLTEPDGSTGVVARLDPAAPREEFHTEIRHKSALRDGIGGLQVRTDVVPGGPGGGVVGVLIALPQADRERAATERRR